MAVYSFEQLQYLPCGLERAWNFFSDPANLPLITPENMQFRIISKGASASRERIYAGQLIEYRLRPLPFMRVYWMTEITHVVEGRYFIDEQRRGPYRLWHHQHHFREVAGGVEMRDIVHYQLPLGVLGVVAHRLLVAGRLEEIFAYRRKKVEEIFGKWDDFGLAGGSGASGASGAG